MSAADTSRIPETFTITDRHRVLLRFMWVAWNNAEFGAPAIHPKRPYGNTDALRSIHELLNPTECEWDEEHGMPASLTPAQWADRRVEYLKLHHETSTALQIMLQLGRLEAGQYHRERYSSKPWRLVHGGSV